MINSYGGSLSTKHQRVLSPDGAQISPDKQEESNGDSKWYTYMSRFTQYVNDSLQHKEPNKHLDNQSPTSGPKFRNTTTNSNFPRRPRTLLETNPLRHGLPIAQ